MGLPFASVHLGCPLICAICSYLFRFTNGMDLHKAPVHLGYILVCTKWPCSCSLDVSFPLLFLLVVCMFLGRLELFAALIPHFVTVNRANVIYEL